LKGPSQKFSDAPTSWPSTNPFVFNNGQGCCQTAIDSNDQQLTLLSQSCRYSQQTLCSPPDSICTNGGKSKQDKAQFNKFIQSADLYQQGKMINCFGSILTTFESSSIFGSSWGSIENWLEPKTKPPSRTLACPNP